MGILLYGANIYTPHQVIPDGAILVDGSHIAAIGPRQELGSYASPGPVEEAIDLQGRIVAPGFIDLQVNGAGGKLLTEEPSPGTVQAMAAALPQFGCTSFLPTIISAPSDSIVEGLRAVAQASQAPSGARVLGAHLEGPFINPSRAGAHSTEFIRPPSVEEFRRYWESGGGCIKLLTIAPELPGALGVTAEARSHGVTVALGHSEAGYAQVVEAELTGFRFVTHLFNAMGSLESREPGTAGAVLAIDSLSAGLIADGVHVHPASLKLALRAKGSERLVLVTDAMPPVGTDLSEFQLYGMSITVKNGACFTPQGVLAGSVLTMDRAISNMCRLADVSFLEALAMATINPARIVGVDQQKGSLEVGKDADLVVCDGDLRVSMTMVEGNIAYRSPDL